MASLQGLFGDLSKSVDIAIPSQHVAYLGTKARRGACDEEYGHLELWTEFRKDLDVTIPEREELLSWVISLGWRLRL